jgi:hypothetical protein
MKMILLSLLRALEIFSIRNDILISNLFKAINNLAKFNDLTHFMLLKRIIEDE